MNKEDIRDFLKFLDTAGEAEILEKQRKLLLLATKVGTDVQSDIKLCLRLIDEELLAREDLKKFSQR